MFVSTRNSPFHSSYTRTTKLEISENKNTSGLFDTHVAMNHPMDAVATITKCEFLIWENCTVAVDCPYNATDCIKTSHSAIANILR